MTLAIPLHADQIGKPGFTSASSIARSLSATQAHALALLEIQDAKRGWARYVVLESLGAKMLTLRSLERRKLVEGKFPDGSGAGMRSSMQWRLTAGGETIAKYLKSQTSL